MNEGYPDVEPQEKELKKLQAKYKKGELSDTTYEASVPMLVDEIAKGHNYIFIGKVGQFVPVVEGSGGGWLLREKDGKYYNTPGSSGYRWKTSEVIKSLKKEDQIDISYWENQAHDAMSDITAFGDYNWFISDDPYIKSPKGFDEERYFGEYMNPPEPIEDLPWDLPE